MAKTDLGRALETVRTLATQFSALKDLDEALSLAVGIEKKLPDLEARKANLETDIATRQATLTELDRSVAASQGVYDAAMAKLTEDSRARSEAIEADLRSRWADAQKQIADIQDNVNAAKKYSAETLAQLAADKVAAEADLESVRSAIADLKSKIGAA